MQAVVTQLFTPLQPDAPCLQAGEEGGIPIAEKIPRPLGRVVTGFKKGDPVPVSGSYLCVPCGYVQYFEAGGLFTECYACLAGTAFGPEGYREGEAEFWQFLG